ncbi:MAG: hypothetical protein IH589_04510 [Anaerolineales bacterium]|nr:hypothetical protein [Anaerolineales bacterium]
MATPAPVCNPGTTVQGAIDDLLPGYIDITKVSTSLDGVMLTVVFSLRELPSQITINKMELRSGVGEIGWGVAIDSDNDPNTGGSSSHSPYGIGYNALLQASHYKTAGGEQTGAIEKLFSDKTNVWEFKPNGHYSVIANGTISIDLQKSKTISLTAKVRNITLQSYLTFYTTYKTNNEQFSDILCER